MHGDCRDGSIGTVMNITVVVARHEYNFICVAGKTEMLSEAHVWCNGNG